MKSFFTFLLIITSGVLFAQPAGWHYALPITITNNSATLVTDYQMKVYVNTADPIAANHMQATGADIRFDTSCTATGNNYSYWIDSGLNSTTTKIWVKIDTLQPSATVTIYMMYGNDTASPMSSIGIFNGPFSATDSIEGGNSGGFSNCQRGFRFAPNEDILVTQFGKYEPSGTTRYITLFDFSTQAIVSQAQVSGAASEYSYAGIPDTMWLAQDTSYVLEQFGLVTDGYFYQTSSQMNAHLTYQDMRYYNGNGDQNTFPDQVLNDYQYGYPDMLFYTRNHVSPEPTDIVGTEVSFASPAATITANPGTNINSGQSVTFTATVVNGGTLTYQWRKNAADIASATNNTYTSNALANNDKISVLVHSTGTCATVDSAHSDTLTMHVVSLGVAQLNVELGNINLYPNPNDGTFTLHAATTSDVQGTVQVTNAVGQVVYSDAVISAKGEINKQISLTTLPDGLYSLQIKAGGATVVKKLVIQK